MTQISHDAGQQREPARTVLAGQTACDRSPTLRASSSSRSQRAMRPTTTLTLSDLPCTIRGRPLASAGICGGCYSFSYSLAKRRVVVAMGSGHQPRTALATADVVWRLVERRVAQLVVAATCHRSRPRPRVFLDRDAMDQILASRPHASAVAGYVCPAGDFPCGC